MMYCANWSSCPSSGIFVRERVYVCLRVCVLEGVTCTVPVPGTGCVGISWPVECSEVEADQCAARWRWAARQTRVCPCSPAPWTFSWTWAPPWPRHKQTHSTPINTFHRSKTETWGTVCHCSRLPTTLCNTRCSDSRQYQLSYEFQADLSAQGKAMRYGIQSLCLYLVGPLIPVHSLFQSFRDYMYWETLESTATDWQRIFSLIKAVIKQEASRCNKRQGKARQDTNTSTSNLVRARRDGWNTKG